MKKYIQPNSNITIVEGNMLLITPPSQVVEFGNGTVTGKKESEVF